MRLGDDTPLLTQRPHRPIERPGPEKQLEGQIAPKFSQAATRARREYIFHLEAAPCLAIVPAIASGAGRSYSYSTMRHHPAWSGAPCATACATSPLSRATTRHDGTRGVRGNPRQRWETARAVPRRQGAPPNCGTGGYGFNSRWAPHQLHIARAARTMSAPPFLYVAMRRAICRHVPAPGASGGRRPVFPPCYNRPVRGAVTEGDTREEDG